MKIQTEFWTKVSNIRLLIYLSEQEKPTRARKIARAMNYSVSNTCKVTTRLEKQGLVIKKIFGRERRIQLSEKGWRIATQLREINEILEGFSK